MPEQEIARIQLALCLMEKECPKCQGELIESAEYAMARRNGILCPDCHGTGSVPLLEGVREKCDCDYHIGRGGIWVSNDGCPKCRGLGWGPSTDLWAYIRGIDDLPTNIIGINEWENILCHELPRGKLEFYEATAKALGVKE